MAYLNLIKDGDGQGLYLKQSGSDKYLDKATPSQNSTANNFKITFPKEWLTKDDNNFYLPKTLTITDLGDKQMKFRNLEILKQFSLPMNKDDFERFENNKETIGEFCNEIYKLIKEKIQFVSEEFRQIVPPSISWYPNDLIDKENLKLPKFIFSQNEKSKLLSDKSIVFPLPFDSDKVGYTDPSIGDVFLWVIWMSGLTIYPYILRPTLNAKPPDQQPEKENVLKSTKELYERYVLQIRQRPNQDFVTQPPNMETLDNALKLVDGIELNKKDDLGDILENLEGTTEIKILTLPQIDNYSGVKLDLPPLVTFTEVMDRLVTTIGNSYWDWQGDRCAYLRLNNSNNDNA